jgi:hypothetical protein
LDFRGYGALLGVAFAIATVAGLPLPVSKFIAAG